MPLYVPIIPKKPAVPVSGFNAPASPETATQWKTALKEVKLLCIQRQYKQCAALSTELLKTASGPVSRPVYGFLRRG